MKKNDLSYYGTLKYKITLCFCIAVFFYFFLVFFLPFGIDNYNPNHKYTLGFFFEIFKFAIGVFIASIVNEIVLRPLLVKNTSLKNIILWSMWTLFLLSSLVFYIYNFLGGWHDYLLKSYLDFLVNVSSVLIFPLIGVFFFFKYRSLQYQIERILTTKERFLDKKQFIEFKGQGSKDQIKLTLFNFLYGKSQDNYVELYYLENRKIKKILLRSTLSNLFESINSVVIIRCHRSYIINLLNVSTVKGGNFEMTLNIDPFDVHIPVSKSYRESTLENLRKVKNFG